MVKGSKEINVKDSLYELLGEALEHESEAVVYCEKGRDFEGVVVELTDDYVILESRKIKTVVVFNKIIAVSIQLDGD